MEEGRRAEGGVNFALLAGEKAEQEDENGQAEEKENEEKARGERIELAGSDGLGDGGLGG